MTVGSSGELFEALGQGEFNRLLGTDGSAWVEFKQDPYHLKTPRDSWELAKDVAAFANHQGGTIVIGVTAQRQSHEVTDRAVEIHGVNRALIDPEQYRMVIESWTRPPVMARFAWYPTDPPTGAGTKTLFVIEVSPVDEADRYVVLRRMLGDQDRPVESFAVAVRNQGVVRWLPAEEVHRLITDGLRGRVPPAEAPPSSEASEEDFQTALADRRLDDLEQWQGWEAEPVIFLQAVPPRTISLITGLHESDGIRGALEHYRPLRPAGFHLGAVGLRAREGGLSSLGDGRRGLMIDVAGVVTAGGVATFDFFAWASRPYIDERQDYRLNPVPLVEYTSEFCRFLARNIFAVGGRPPNDWRLRVVGRRLKSEGTVVLGPGRLDSFSFPIDARPASGDGFVETVTATDDPDKDAFELLVRLYGWFGLGGSAIPFVDDGRVSEQLIEQIV
jgi:hypothetical protein